MKEEFLQASKWRRTLRLTFSYKGKNIQLENQQSVMMIPPPSTRRVEKKQSGFWYELRSKDGDILYRRVMQNPIRFDYEAFDLPGKEIVRHSVDHPRGIFVLLVPDIPEAREIALFSSPLKPELAQKPAREIACFSLKSQGEVKED